MEIIRKQNEAVAKSWGIPDKKQTVYRPLKYLLQTRVADGLLLHNCITGELWLLNSEEEEVFNSLPAEYCGKMDNFIEHRFIVPEDFDEKNEVLQLRKILRMINRKGYIDGFTILPTTACNARCFYCFEAEHKTITMTDETLDAAIEFIKKSSKGKKVSLSWFGGEPTLCSQKIDKICDCLAAQGIEYKSSMISNGYLFDADMSKKAAEKWHLGFVQITLDGTEEIYNRVKAYVNPCDSPFKRVLDNIEAALENNITVSVRMNLDRHNEDDLETLIKLLGERFGGKKNFSAYVAPLFKENSFGSGVRSEKEHKYLLDKTVSFDVLLKQNRIFSENSKGLPVVSGGHCMADRDGSVIIYPDGKLIKCEHCDSSDAVGDVWNGITDKAAISGWKETVEYPVCGDCPIYPTCVNLKNCFSTGECYKQTREKDINRFVYELGKCYEGYKAKQKENSM